MSPKDFATSAGDARAKLASIPTVAAKNASGVHG